METKLTVILLVKGEEETAIRETKRILQRWYERDADAVSPYLPGTLLYFRVLSAEVTV